MKLFRVVFTAVLLGALTLPLALPVSPARAQSSKRAKANFVSQKHKFAMYLPVKPKVSSRLIGSQKSANLTSFVAYSQPVVYMAMVVAVPASEDDMARANYFDMAQKLWASGEFKPDNVSNMRLTGARDSVVNGKRVRELILSCDVLAPGTSQPVQASFQLLIFKEGRRAYFIGAAVPMSQRARYLSQIHRVLGSVRLYK